MFIRPLAFAAVAIFTLTTATAAMTAERQRGRPLTNPALSVLPETSPARSRAASQAFHNFGQRQMGGPPSTPGGAANPTRVNPLLLRDSRGQDGRPQRPPTPTPSGELNGQRAF